MDSDKEETLKFSFCKKSNEPPKLLDYINPKSYFCQYVLYRRINDKKEIEFLTPCEKENKATCKKECEDEKRQGTQFDICSGHIFQSCCHVCKCVIKK